MAVKKYTLDSIVRELLIEMGENSEHKFPRFLQYGIAGLRELNLDVSGINKIAVLDVNDNNTVDLPADYIEYTRIGFCNSSGTISFLGANGDMCLPRDFDDCGDRIESKSNNDADTFIYWNSYEGGHFRNGEVVGRYFGIGGGTNANGHYRVDEENNFIALQDFKGDKLWLEYIADISRNLNGEFEVHPYIVEPLKAWIYWKSIQRNARISGGDKQMAKQEWLAQYKRAKGRFASFTLEEAKQVIRSSFTQAPKI